MISSHNRVLSPQRLQIERVRWVLLSAFLAFAIAPATTSQDTRIAVISFTIFGIMSLMIGAFFLFLKTAYQRHGLIAGFSVFGIILYAVVARLLSSGGFPSFNGPESAFGDNPTVFNIMITVILSACFVKARQVFTSRSLWLCLLIIYVFLGLSYLLGGFILTPVPKINFEFSDEGYGATLYSQGFSRLAALTALISAVLILKSRSLIPRVVSLLSFAVGMGLCLIGGGRGEFVALLVAVLVLYRRNVSVLLAFALLALLAVVYFGDFLGELHLVARLAVFFVGDYGMRDALIVDALSLLGRNPQCVVVGCGFGYFQHALNYPSGLYPHNLLLEATLVFGLPAVFAATVFGYLQLRRFARASDEFMVALVVFLTLLALKGGTMFSDPYLMAFFIGSTLGGIKMMKSHIPSSGDVGRS